MLKTDFYYIDINKPGRHSTSNLQNYGNLSDRNEYDGSQTNVNSTQNLNLQRLKNDSKLTQNSNSDEKEHKGKKAESTKARARYYKLLKYSDF